MANGNGKMLLTVLAWLLCLVPMAVAGDAAPVKPLHLLMAHTEVDRRGIIYELDGQSLRTLFLRPETYLSSIAQGPDGTVYFTIANRFEVFKLTPGGTETVSRHSTYVRKVVCDRKGDLYFSEASGGRTDGKIFRVREGKAELFFEVKLTAVEGHWTGQFDFDSGNALWLTSGNKLPGSLFRVADGVVHKMDTRPDGYSSFCLDDSDALLIPTRTGIVRATLPALQRELAYALPEQRYVSSICVARVPCKGLPPPPGTDVKISLDTKTDTTKKRTEGTPAATAGTAYGSAGASDASPAAVQPPVKPAPAPATAPGGAGIRDTLPATAQPPAKSAPVPASAPVRQVTFRTAEKAPAQFGAWRFLWTAPSRDADAKLEYVVLQPDGKEYFRRDVSQVKAGVSLQCDFSPGFAGGDPSVFHNQDVTVVVRVSKGGMVFAPAADPYFVFRKDRRDVASAAGTTKSFSGSINQALRPKEDYVYVVPTHETDKVAEREIHADVKTIRDRFSKDAPILTDEEALQKDLSDKAVILYGTLKGNRWVERNLPTLPVIIEPNRIVAGAEYAGTDLRFISVWPNPGNPQRGMVLYTAQQAKDVPGINNVFHGPTDYIVFRNRENVLQQEFYFKGRGRWEFPVLTKVGAVMEAGAPAAPEPAVKLNVRMIEIHLDAQGKGTLRVLSDGAPDAEAKAELVKGQPAALAHLAGADVRRLDDRRYHIVHDFSVFQDLDDLFPPKSRFADSVSIDRHRRALILTPLMRPSINSKDKWVGVWYPRLLKLPVTLRCSLSDVGSDPFCVELSFGTAKLNVYLFAERPCGVYVSWYDFQTKALKNLVEVERLLDAQVQYSFECPTVPADCPSTLKFQRLRQPLAVHRLEVTAGVASSIGAQFEDRKGQTVVQSVLEGTAARAGVRPGDIITAVNDRPVPDAKSCTTAIREFSPGDALRLTVTRDGQKIVVPVTAE